MNYLISAGINKYQYTTKLRGCINDANDISIYLQKYFNFIEHSLLLDEQATVSNFTKDIQSACLIGKKDDTILIYYSGHGTQRDCSHGDEEDRRDEALCLYDGILVDDDLVTFFRSEANIILISDSCHSGTLAKSAKPIKSIKSNKIIKSMQFDSSLVIHVKNRYRSSKNDFTNHIISFTGCQDHEYSYDGCFNGKPNGVFTYNLIKCTDTLRVTGKTTYYNLQREINKVLPTIMYPQTPSLLGAYCDKNLF